MYRSAEQIERDYIRNVTLQRREQHARKYASVIPPEPKMEGVCPYVMYVWRHECWILVAFTKVKPTAKRMLHWRKRYRIKPKEIVRYKSLWEAQRNGPPIDDPFTGGRVEITNALRHRKEQRIVHQAIKRAIIRGTPDMPRCGYGRQTRKHCTRKGTWLVGYVSSTTWQKRVISRCTDHAWNRDQLPSTAMQVIRVQRSTLN